MHTQTTHSKLIGNTTMPDWPLVYQRLMDDFKGRGLLIHIGIMGTALVLGMLIGFYWGGNLLLTLLFVIIGVLVDYLVLGSDEFLDLFNRRKPYLVRTLIQNRIKQRSEVEDDYERLIFEVFTHEAYALGRSGLSADNYYEKEGEQRIEVPETMFLSLNPGQEVHLVCMPDDYVWGILNDGEVIYIEE